MRLLRRLDYKAPRNDSSRGMSENIFEGMTRKKVWIKLCKIIILPYSKEKRNI